MLQITDDMSAITSAGDSVVAFTATWCGPCKQLKPQFVKASAMDSNKDYFIIDIDKIDKKYLDEYNIKSVPAVFTMNAGIVQKRINARTAPDMLEEINNEIN